MKNIFKLGIYSICVLGGISDLVAQPLYGSNGRSGLQNGGSSKHEISVTGGLGSSALKYSVHQGSHKSKMGQVFGLGYAYHINESFAIRSGLEVAFYGAEAKLDHFTDSYVTTDAVGKFNFNTEVNNFKEKQTATYLNIPILGQYQWPAFGGNKYYVAGGLTIGIPLTGKYKTSSADFKTTGSDFDYIENPPTIEDNQGLGFYSFKGRSISETQKFNVSVALSVEAGVKWALTKDLELYSGIYGNFGLNDIRKKDKDKNFLEYQAPYANVKAEDFQQNSILNSQISNNQNITGNVRVMEIGLKLRLAYNL